MTILVIKMPHFGVFNVKSVLSNFIKVEHHFWHFNTIIWLLNAGVYVYKIDTRAAEIHQALLSLLILSALFLIDLGTNIISYFKLR